MVHGRIVDIEHRVHNEGASPTQTRQTTANQLADRFLRLGIDSLEDHEIVELLFSLSFSCGRYDKQARKCIGQFGSLREVIEASPAELRKGGVTPAAILCIRLISEVLVRVLKQRIIGRPVYKSSQEVFEYLYYSMRGLKNEVFKVIYLNSRNQIIETLDLFRGTVNYIPLCPREIVQSAIEHRAVSMIFAHNHPSGDPNPSKSDKQLTRDLVFIGSVIQIKIQDHIIIGDNNYFSFAAEGLIEKYEDNFLTLRIKAGT